MFEHQLRYHQEEMSSGAENAGKLRRAFLSVVPRLERPSAEQSPAKGYLTRQVWLVACHGQKSYPERHS